MTTGAIWTAGCTLGTRPDCRSATRRRCPARRTSTSTSTPGRVAEAEDILAALGGGDFLVWDCRSADEFAGRRSAAARAGHIPGAVNLDWLDLMDRDPRPSAGRQRGSAARRARHHGGSGHRDPLPDAPSFRAHLHGSAPLGLSANPRLPRFLGRVGQSPGHAHRDRLACLTAVHVSSRIEFLWPLGVRASCWFGAPASRASLRRATASAAAARSVAAARMVRRILQQAVETAPDRDFQGGVQGRHDRVPRGTRPPTSTASTTSSPGRCAPA